ncbi:MAG: hypothetical protein P1P72_03585 [ANME-2 cluster archaeon]|nr:hypothetical protein [ANME-2 cluster archaeon]
MKDERVTPYEEHVLKSVMYTSDNPGYTKDEDGEKISPIPF